MPIQVADIELTNEIQAIQLKAGFDRLRGLVRLRGEPIGWIDLDCTRAEISAAQLIDAIRQQLSLDILRSVLAPSPAATDMPLSIEPISVIVCTRDRPDRLERLLHSLVVLEYPAFEIIVVDNAPSDDSAVKLCAQFPVCYVREDRVGLDWARNCGIAEARYEIVAFVDDDAHPDPHWLDAVNRGFADPSVMAVTGLVIPDELETEPQIRFELNYGGMGRGLRPRIANGSVLTDRDLLWASAFGVGTNMAFRRRLFQSIGGFDNALDVGTPSRGAGDNEMFFRLLSSGFTLVYAPKALVWHTHRRDEAGLHRTMFNNGCSVGAFLFTCWRNRSIRRRSIVTFLLNEWLAWWILRRLIRPDGFPRYLVLLELAGTLASPFAYASSRRQAKQAQILDAGDTQEHGRSPVRSGILAPIGKLANAILVLWGLA